MNIQKHLFRTQAWFLQTVEVIKVIQRIFVINSWKCARLFSFVVSQGVIFHPKFPKMEHCVSPTPPAPPAAPTLAWLPALERLEVCLQISAVTVTVPAGPESGGGAAGDAERTADPLPAAAGHHPAPVPGRVRSSSDSGHRYCLHGQLVSVLPSVRLDSAALKSAALPTVPEVPVRLTRSSAAAAGSQLRLPSQTQQVMSPSVVVRDCAPIPRPTPPPPHNARCSACRAPAAAGPAVVVLWPCAVTRQLVVATRDRSRTFAGAPIAEKGFAHAHCRGARPLRRRYALRCRHYCLYLVG
ncbi:verprolin-like [Amphibalanus amphitrite]|uniref:verprolin-like n=1 Tax=Amphibalanus amphitrite TaxID=1232801 RepID=UPI001C92A358|nr:verprolin-like [Amphibalanus amphitrite]